MAMASQNDALIMALEWERMTRAKLKKFDLSALRSFERKPGGGWVIVFYDKYTPNVDNSENFYAALDDASAVAFDLYSR